MSGDIAKVETADVVLQPSNESSALISMIERAAKDPKVDIDKMERLFQMHERVQDKAAQAEYAKAMAAAQFELKENPVIRTKTNNQTNTKYADLSAISDAADPIIHKFGFGTSYGEFKPEKDQHFGILVEVMHSGGHMRVYRFEVPNDNTGIKGTVNKTAMWAFGSSMSYGRRYAKLAVFDIVTKDAQDNDGQDPTALITDDQVEMLKERMPTEDIPLFCEFFKLEKLGDLPAAQLPRALQTIEITRQKRAASDD